MKHIETISALGREVVRLRREQHLTQKELGRLVGMSQSTLARLETGGIAEFGSRKLMRILAALGQAITVVPVASPFTLDDALAQRRREAAEGLERT